MTLAQAQLSSDRRRYIDSLSRECPQFTLCGVARDTEPIVRVLELRWDAGAGRAARHLDVVTPGAAAGGAPLAGFRAARIALERHRVVVGRVPVAAPLVHVVAHVEEAVCVGFGAADGFGTGLPMTSAPTRVAGQNLR